MEEEIYYVYIELVSCNSIINLWISRESKYKDERLLHFVEV